MVTITPLYDRTESLKDQAALLYDAFADDGDVEQLVNALRSLRDEADGLLADTTPVLDALVGL